MKSSKNSSHSENGMNASLWRVFWVVAGLCLWVLMQVKEERVRLGGFFLACIFLLWRFRSWKTVFVFAGLFSVLSLSALFQQNALPEEGIYRIVDRKERYAIAQKDWNRVVVYDVEAIDLQDRVEIKTFEELHSLNNPGVFSFETYMEQQNIRFSGTVQHVQKDEGWNLKRWVWKTINAHPQASWYRLMFYGWSENEAWQGVMMTGLPLIAICSALRTFLSRFLSQKICSWILIVIQVSLLFLFPIRPAVVRLILFSLAKTLFSDWEIRWSLSLILFLLLYPGMGLSMSLLMPAGLSFVSRYASDQYRRPAQIFWCALIQILSTGKLDFLLLFGFLGLRNLFGTLFLVSLAGLGFPGLVSPVASLVEKVRIPEDLFCVYGTPPVWFAVFLFVVLARFLLRANRKTMISALAIFCLYPFVWRLDPFFHVYQLDVGQGDAAIIVEPFTRSAVMIDAAGRFNHDQASELFIPFLQGRQISHLDALIVSHSDFDHSGSVESLSLQFDVDQIITQSDQKVPVDYVFELLLEERIADEEEANDQSLICRFGYDGQAYLWTGDASMHIEKQLIERYEVKSAVLKLGHHGSDTSSCREFLRAVEPELALISSGKDNRYGHPSLSVLKSLEEQGIDRLNTADHGCLHIQSLKRLMIVTSADGLFARIQSNHPSGK